MAAEQLNQLAPQFDERLFTMSAGVQYALKWRIASDVRFAIDAAFRARGIQIPFPQRDLHLRSGFGNLETG